MKLRNYVNTRIQRREQKIIGHAVSSPYIKTIGGQSVWVVDVLRQSDAELMESVPIAENNRQVRNFVGEGVPVEIQRSNAGQFYISGLADTQKNDVHKKVYTLDTYGFGFSDGWKKDESGNYESGGGNQMDPGTESQVYQGYTFVAIPYDELDYGVTVYGAKRMVRTT